MTAEAGRMRLLFIDGRRWEKFSLVSYDKCEEMSSVIAIVILTSKHLNETLGRCMRPIYGTLAMLTPGWRHSSNISRFKIAVPWSNGETIFLVFPQRKAFKHQNV
jgi:hypothetical protein